MRKSAYYVWRPWASCMAKHPASCIVSPITDIPCTFPMSKRPFQSDKGDSLGRCLQTPSPRCSPPPKRTKTDATLKLDYPSPSHKPERPTPFQQPTQIISFSHTSSGKLEFTDSALRYLVDPPPGANLGHGYEKWVRKPDQRGRVDGLLEAFSKSRRGPSSAILRDVEVVAWRGVMTRYATTMINSALTLQI